MWLFRQGGEPRRGTRAILGRAEHDQFHSRPGAPEAVPLGGSDASAPGRVSQCSDNTVQTRPMHAPIAAHPTTSPPSFRWVRAASTKLITSVMPVRSPLFAASAGRAQALQLRFSRAPLAASSTAFSVYVASSCPWGQRPRRPRPFLARRTLRAPEPERRSHPARTCSSPIPGRTPARVRSRHERMRTSPHLEAFASRITHAISLAL